MTTKSRLTAVLAIAAAVGIGLATPSLAQTAAPGAPATVSAPFCGHYWGSLPKASTPMVSLAPILNVRSGQHSCFDRMVIDIGGQIGGYTVQYRDQNVDGPDASWHPRGGAYLAIFVQNPASRAGWESGTADPVIIPDAANVAGYRTFRQIMQVHYNDYDGGVHLVPDMFALGVRAHLPFRVFTLAGPGDNNRLVIDVAHKW